MISSQRRRHGFRMIVRREATYELVVVFITILLQAPLSLGIPFPNSIEGLPEVYCGETSVSMSVVTESGNPSHMFVVGRHDDPACVTRNDNAISVEHETCGLVRERNLSPPGIMYRLCVSVQLHPQFVTKVDRTFCARCFYTEGVNELTRDLEVSAQGSTEVPVSFDAPVCTYTIRRGSPTGEEIRYATVGEPVYHVWHCPSQLNGMLVQNCYVEDGQGNRILIIDQNGCGIDRYVMQTPDYTKDLTMAFQEAHVFKFADKTITRFTCQLKICIKTGGGCDDVTPPRNCPVAPGPTDPLNYAQSRYQRAVRVDLGARSPDGKMQWVPYEAGVTSSPIALAMAYSNHTVLPASIMARSVLDDFEVDVSNELVVLDDSGDAVDQFLRGERDTQHATHYSSENHVCVPRRGAALIIVLSLALGLFGMIVVMFTAKRRRSKCESTISCVTSAPRKYTN